MTQARIGVDIIEINRIQDAISRWGDHFLGRIYTRSELEIYRNKPESLAARFAGKEAVMKALGGENITLSWLDIEILSEESGQPLIKLGGQARERSRELGIDRLEISLSHSRHTAIALVMGLIDL
jgi:holo-[acyl-carrier protein] synthase